MSGIPVLVAVMTLGTSVLVPAVYASNIEPPRNEVQVAPAAENSTVDVLTAVSSMLQEARSKIQGEDTKKYYDKLVADYDMDEPPASVNQTEDSNQQVILPDFEKIQKAAIILPLQEAGKQIKDKEIADFYYKLLKDSGWTIKAGK